MIAAAFPRWFDLSIAVGNLTLSAVAVVYLVRAARYTNPRMRPIYAASAVLAAMYCAGFVWLVIDPTNPNWSPIMRPVGLLSWWFAWARPARESVRVWRETRR